MVFKGHLTSPATLCPSARAHGSFTTSAHRATGPCTADFYRRVMRVKMILPALTEATSPLFRPIKYSLFPPLGLATLAGYLPADAEVSLHDEHVQRLRLDDDPVPDLVVIQVYITSARRSY